MIFVEDRQEDTDPDEEEEEGVGEEEREEEGREETEARDLTHTVCVRSVRKSDTQRVR